MSNNFGHVQRVTKEIGGKIYTFRSLLEMRWAIWCQLRKEQGIILGWWYEDEENLLELETRYFKNRKLYLPDFTILTTEGGYEYEECKGWFPAKDYTKIKLATEQYDNDITLIFAKKPYKVQLRRAKRLEPHIKRIIWNADRDIFKPIKHLFVTE